MNQDSPIFGSTAGAVALGVACLGLVTGLQRFAVGHPSVVLLSVALIGVALAVVWGAAHNSRRLVAGGTAVFLISFLVLLALSSATTTQGDESLYTRFATEIMRHGGNPYLRNISTATLHYAAPASGLTTHWDGSVVTTFPYPAGLLWLTWVASAVPFFATPTVALNAIAVVAIALLLWRRCGWQSVAVYALVLMAGENLNVLARGNSDIVIVPFIMWLMLKIPTFDPRQRGQLLLFGSVLGLALAIKQNAWLLSPFVVIALRSSLVDRGKPVVRPLAMIILITSVVFGVCNLTFITRDGSTWLHAILSPLQSDGVPAGQGLISIPMYFGGDLSTTLVALTLVTMLLALLVAPTLRGRPSLLMVMGGVVPTLVSSRSFLHYIITLAPLALVALGSDVPEPQRAYRGRGFVLLAPAIAGVVLLWNGATPPNDISVRAYVLQPGTTNVEALTVRVAESIRQQASSFRVSHDGMPSQEWIVQSRHGDVVTLRIPVGAVPLTTTTPFQVAVIDSAQRYRYVSAPKVVAPISVLVATGKGVHSLTNTFTVHLTGPHRLVTNATVRVTQTAAVFSGIQPEQPAYQYLFTGTTGRTGVAEWRYRCHRGSSAKVAVEVLDRAGQTIFRSPLGIFACSESIPVK